MFISLSVVTLMLARCLAMLNKNKISCLFKAPGGVLEDPVLASELESSSASLCVTLCGLHPF